MRIERWQVRNGVSDTEFDVITDADAHAAQHGGEVALVVRNVVDESYRGPRAANYPNIGDQLDALWKVVEKMDGLPIETVKLLSEIQRVKNMYPKPEENGKLLGEADSAG